MLMTDVIHYVTGMIVSNQFSSKHKTIEGIFQVNMQINIHTKSKKLATGTNADRYLNFSFHTASALSAVMERKIEKKNVNGISCRKYELNSSQRRWDHM